MSGTFSTGGLITGLDTQSIIQQLIQLERQPILRIQNRITELEAQKTAITDLRSTLQTLRNRVQDFRITDVFGQFEADVSDSTVFSADVTGSNPTPGSFAVEVVQLAGATVATSSARLGSPINTAAALDSSGISTTVTSGQFTINGAAFNIDATTQSLDTIISSINSSGAGVTATYDALTDTLSLANTTPGDTSIINLGASGDTSNFLAALSLTNATQSTNGSGSTELVSTSSLGTIRTNDILNTVSFSGGAVTAGSFAINGISITIDPTTDTLDNIIARINSSDAGVTANFDSASDTIRVVSDTLGSRTISFTSGTSNFLDITNLTTASQVAGTDSQFRVNGGALQTRNTNQVSDAVTGITLDFLSIGTSTVTASTDETSITTDIQEFIDAFNESITHIAAITGENGVTSSDGTIRSIASTLRSNIFAGVTGLSGNLQSLQFIGITSGDDFDSSQTFQLTLDSETFLEALSSDRGNVENLISNDGDTGIFDQLFEYLDEITGITGFLNERAKGGGSIDDRITLSNDQMDSLERRVEMKEIRLRTRFAAMERLASTFQAQAASFASIGANLNN